MENLRTAFDIVFYIYCAAACYQLFHILFFHFRLGMYKDDNTVDRTDYPPLSVVICAKNEDVNLKKNLPVILQQDYPQFEVIVVDDNSDDGTTEYLFFLAQKEPRLKRVKVGEVNRLMAGKKFALTLGIKAANHELVVLTDADCYPASSQWLKHIAKKHQNKKQIVLGYGAYEKLPGFLNKTIRFETLQAALSYMGFALAGLPYMGVGRNLSYRKNLFFEHGGFTEHRTILSGDDDLFINKVANGKNTALLIDREAFTYSTPKQSWAAWQEQKTRHLSTGKYYKFIHKFFLGMYSVSHILYYITLAFLLIVLHQWLIAAGIFILRLILLRIAYLKAMKKLDENDLSSYIELFDLMQIVYYIRFAKTVLFKTNYRWN
jgi:glycosyltransferase involved in cell wall biosynthesis